LLYRQIFWILLIELVGAKFLPSGGFLFGSPFSSSPTETMEHAKARVSGQKKPKIRCVETWDFAKKDRIGGEGVAVKKNWKTKGRRSRWGGGEGLVRRREART